MPLKNAKGKSKKAVQTAVSANIRELMADNKKKAKPRSKQQIIAIAISAAKRKSTKK